MGEFSAQVLNLFTRAAAEQGGIISGDNPTQVNLADPLRLWIIQLVIIISMTQFLAVLLGRIRQPRVIAEVIAGVILGPSIMGHIPNFRQAIFPLASLPFLTLTANIGLVLFLFLIAMEVDTKLLRRNIVASATISVAGLVIPLGLGAALGVAVYKEFVDNTVNYGYFLLFVAVAIGITAFPVLCRILTELQLLDTEVGLIVLSAGIGNDVVGWVLLALAVALVNAASGLTALWVLLASAGYTIALLYPGRWGYTWLAKRTGSLEQGTPTAFMMTITLIIVFASAFFTDIIGVHPIFGGFLAGLIIPHENGYAISIVEKLEDLVSIVFLPIYFTLSGLNTNLSLLNDGTTWGYVFLICTVALFSKFLSCSATAHFNGFGWREAGAIGSLMSCKGLVELIVLNIGLQANILNPKVFSMFVVHAIFVTFLTTPLVLFFYPSKYRSHLRNNNKENEGKAAPANTGEEYIRTRFALVLDKMEALPAAMTLSQLLHSYVVPARPMDTVTSSFDEKLALEVPDSEVSSSRPVIIEALRLLELTNRTSAVLRSQESESLLYNDPLISSFRTFGQLNEFSVSANISVVNSSEFSDAIADHVNSTKSQMVIIPWPRGITSVSEEENTDLSSRTRNPFDGVFNRTTAQDQTSSVVYSEFIRSVFAKSPSDVALFVDRGLVRSYGLGSKRQHLFLAFMGGPDDRLALTFLLQLCGHSSVSATVIRVKKTDSGVAAPDNHGSEHPTIEHTTIHNSAADTVYPQLTSQTRMSSDLADNLLWDRYSLPNASRSPQVAAALSRISFRVESTPTPLRRIAELAKEVAKSNAAASGKTMIALVGRSRRLAVESLGLEFRKLTTELGAPVSSSLPKTLGDVGAALVATNVDASLLVIQTAATSYTP